ncbi:lytic transglycosylase domain-containing protein [Haloflavibacter putidus]|uniref:LysM peptidoglycan-binding domain-containing protein n=1 Tax=Haloflavibacter putidus TaxID=2576776 RepID=A0A507ZYF2_9FLAO|nr:lytic transglycosylase domain-containing protein [Haloflavibacter putidus]TQD40738.1 LysM peptidoglycan-binding domain-containing protein [Haloflavibacter putidus]
MRNVLFILFFLPIVVFGQKELKEQPIKETAAQTANPDSTDLLIPDYTTISPIPEILKDSVVFALKDYKKTAVIDSLWIKELINSDLYPKMRKAISKIAKSEELETEDEIIKHVPTDTLKKRLAMLDAKTPFNISYNTSLESVIHYYLKRDRESMERLMALSAYYFPMFEQKLDKYHIPLEMKYLAIVESALNPRAKSRVGATGLWQFMFATGKMHDLNVSSYVDERMDPLKSTEAAAQYLKRLYGMFNDWDLALASYNSGPGNVSKAIRRSGGNTNYWEMRRFLPRETAGYVPAFLATMYIFEFSKEHGFEPYKPEVTYYETDTIKVKQLLKFEQISKVTGIDKELLSFLNPSYKLGIIPFIKGKDYAIRLPLKETGVFVANEDVIYNFVEEKLEEEKESLPRYVEADAKIRYRVRSGDYLGKIAERYGVGVSKIRRWNNLRGNNIRVGQYLTIYPRKPATNVAVTASKTEKKKKTAIDQKIYTVKSGDSLWSISKKFPGITVQNIQKWNDIRGHKLKPGMKLKVSDG